MPKLLSTAYFPPVSYFAAMAEEKIGRIISLAKSFSINKEELIEYIEKGWDNYE